MRIDKNLTPTDLKKMPPKGLSDVELKKWKYQRYMRDYLACIDSVDDNVGRLLDYLDKNDLARNTMVVYTSDQGFFLGDHNWYDKRFMYEESLRMPFLIKWPAMIKAGSNNAGMILNVDFAPTFLAAADEKVPGDIQGRSFLPLLKGEKPEDWRTSMYYRYYHYPFHHQVQPHYGIRTERYKLIYFNKIDQWELYDLEKDPREMKNVYDDPGYADTVKKLKEEMLKLKKDLKDENQFEKEIPKDNTLLPGKNIRLLRTIC
jgi:arylsulfatase A-like enzyme